MHLHLVGLHIGDTAPILAALRAAHPHVQWSATSVVHGQGGASYETLARECRATARLRDGSPLALMTAWEGLRLRYAMPVADGYVIASWSAGYGYTRELLRVEGRPADVVAVVALDSIYAGLGADGQPLAADLAPWVALAGEAVAGGVAFAVGASGIDYMESLPMGQRYASTGRVADAVAHALGLAEYDPPGMQVPARPVAAGSLIIRHYPGQDAAAHTAAVRGWGPALVAEAIGAWLVEHGPASPTAPTEPPPSTLPAPSATGRAVAAYARARGTDVSRWQGPGEGNAWPLWGCAFGFARVATSAKPDETFVANWRQMAGLDLRGAYAWYDPGRDADEQTKVALATLRSAGVDPRGLKLAIDVEPGPYGETAAGLARWRALTGDGAGMVAWFERMRAAGCDVGCYTGRWAWFWRDLLASRGCWLWVADASAASLAAGRPTLIPAGWPEWDQAKPVDWGAPGAIPLIWQCGRQDAVGEPARIDLDLFRGDHVALRQWSGAK